jgi:hypothetical protein
VRWVEKRKGGEKTKKECLEGESNSHLRITQAELGHIYDR